GIGRRLHKNHLCVLLDCCLYIESVRSIDEIKLDVVIGENLREKTSGSTVGIIRNYNVLSCFHETKRRIYRCHAGGKRKPETGAFQGRDVSFQSRASGVLRAGILVALVFTEGF